MAAVDACASRRNGGYVYHATPMLLKHMRDGELGDEEAGAEVDVDGVVPLLDSYVEDVRHAFAVTGVHDEQIWMLTVLLLDFIEQTREVGIFGYVALVGTESATVGMRTKLSNELV